MSIKSIDFQSMYPRVNDVTKVQNDLQHKNLNLLQQQVKTTNDNAEHNMSQVLKREDVQESAVRDGQKKDQNNKKKKKQKKEIDSKNLIDIKI